jgi:F-type H+-transporting ATPase subunit b
MALAEGAARAAAALDATETSTGLVINLFWVIFAAVNFVVFLAVIWAVFFRPVSGTLESRRQRIEQGLKDADEARREREQAAAEKQKVIGEARREATEIITRAQKLAEEARERELAETRTELERVRASAVADIETERLRAMAEVRAQVADLALAAAAKVVGETMDTPRERRLVEEFLDDVASAPAARPQAQGAGS